ncbi:peptidase S41 [Agaricicola taiwanensis]|uniref:Peptidase S41 n=1 Tax=Agaricicola taiwanensis TaxID=591372 RepID=A0A8J2Y9R6_9RHOB|nr:S41 family peptidase [Agaricicola taiwanensis]GGE26967.1 peptidase S41 [Agaricicola taiwanensis]
MRKASLVLAGALLGATAMGVVQQHGLLGTAVAASADTYRYLNLFGDVFERVRSEYVEAPEEQKLIDAAINGMLQSLDPHSAYMDASKYEDRQVDIRGEFGGLGIEVMMENKLVKVVGPIDGTPASRADIRAGDFIVKIDGEDVEGMSLQDAVKKMRGPVNTPITLTIKRDSAEPIDIKIVRDIVKVRVVRHRVEGDNVGYVRIASFSEPTFDNMRSAIEEIKSKVPADKLKGYVVDLRNNPGGLLDQSVQVSDAFLERGEVVSLRGRKADDVQRFSARSGDLTDGKPVIVLTNGGSASASEIVAGALQDHRRATVLGTRSFGKGSVQTLTRMGNQGALSLTTARYYTPCGRSIQAKGIEPDILLLPNVPEELKDKVDSKGEAGLEGHLTNEGGEERSASSTYVPQEAAEDVQLQQALALLRGEKTDANFPPNKDSIPADCGIKSQSAKVPADNAGGAKN